MVTAPFQPQQFTTAAQAASAAWAEAANKLGTCPSTSKATVVSPDDKGREGGGSYIKKRVIKELSNEKCIVGTVVEHVEATNAWRVTFDDEDYEDELWNYDLLSYGRAVYNEDKDFWEGEEGSSAEESDDKSDNGEEGTIDGTESEGEEEKLGE